MVGITGLIGAGLGLYGLAIPAVGLRELLDSQPMDFLTTAVEAVVIVVATAVIAGELVLSAAAVRMTFVGSWPGRGFLLGRPAAATSFAAYAVVALLAVLL
jgi:hypothetical protein